MKKLAALLLTAALLAGCSTLGSEGMAAANSGNYSLAEAKWTEAIRQGDTSLWNNLGVVYERTGRDAQAIRAFQLGARYGDPTAQRNLINRGLPVPAADLANRQSDSNALAEIINSINAGRNSNSSNSTPRGPVFCDSKKGFGNTVNTTCY